MEGGGNPTSKDGSPLKRSFVTFDRGGQTGPPRSNDFFFGAADDMRAADEAERPAERPAKRPAEFLGFRVFGTVIGQLSYILRSLRPVASASFVHILRRIPLSTCQAVHDQRCEGKSR